MIFLSVAARDSRRAASQKKQFDDVLCCTHVGSSRLHNTSKATYLRLPRGHENCATVIQEPGVDDLADLRGITRSSECDLSGGNVGKS